MHIIKTNILSLALVVIMCLSRFPSSAFAAADARVSITLDGEDVGNSYEFFIDANDRAMVPVKFINECLHVQAEWDESSDLVTITSGSTITLTIGSDQITTNGIISTIDTTPVISGGRAFVPIRFVAEPLGRTVGWDAETRTVILTYESAGATGPYEARNRTSTPTITNVDGVELRVGMSREEFEEFYGQPLEDGWQTPCPDIGVTVMSIDGVIVTLHPGEGWTISNGVELGMHADKVIDLLGSQDDIFPEYPEFHRMFYNLAYYFDDGGAMSFLFMRDGRYGHPDYDTIASIVISGASVTDADFVTSGKNLGTISADISGDGDALLEDITVTSPGVTFNITHTGDGAIKVYFIESGSGTERELFSAVGNATGQGRTPGYLTTRGDLRVEAEGEWRIVIKQHTKSIYLSDDGEYWYFEGEDLD